MNKQNLRPCVGGWLLLAGGALSIMRTMISLLYNVVIRGMPLRYLQMMLGYTFLPDIIYAVPLITIGIMLVMKKQGIPVAIGCGIGLVAELVYPLLAQLLARIFGFAVYEAFSFYNILYSLPYILLALTALISAAPKPNPLKKLWWLAGSVCGALEFYVFIANIIDIIRHHAINFRNIFDIVLTLIFGLIAAAGFIFTGQWLANPYRKQPAQPQYDEQTMQALNYYKWQYESGAITWEQYNAAIQPYIQK